MKVPEYTHNRELSWLRFNERVMEEATDDTVPLVERLRFLTIFTTNLDEFFQVRVGSLMDLMVLKKDYRDNKSGLTAKEQLSLIYKAVRPLYSRREDVYLDLERQLRTHGIARLAYSELSGEEKDAAQRYFMESVLPLLAPVVIDSYHPFPHLQNKTIYIVALLESTEGHPVHAMIPVPAALPDVIYLPGEGIRFIATEDLILEMAEVVFDTYTVRSKVQVCITRNADINPEDEDFDVDNDFREVMKQLLSERKRLAPLRMEFSSNPDPAIVEHLRERLGLTDRQIFTTTAPLRLGYAYPLAERLDAEQKKVLLFRPFEPQPSPAVDPRRPILDQVVERDILLSYPYESMDPFLTLVEQASDNPDVVSLQITIYRLAAESRLVEALCAAAENGKDVTVLIELRARFDEQNNIDWSQRLERAGCRVIYGIPNYKVHSKVFLLTYRNAGAIRFVTQVGTGNYNEKTSKLYTDLSLITADQAIGRDAAAFFRNMGIGNLYGQYSELLVAPVSLKQRLIDLFDREIAKGAAGRISLKLNSLTDKDLIDKIAQASAAGVQVRALIRGICCLVPGITDVTDNVEVRSIVGRYLEHSRLYCFGSGEDQEIYLSSADFMTRNTERRVEVAAPIRSAHVRDEINRQLELMWRDTRKARRLCPDGTYETIPGVALDSQGEQMNDAMRAWEESSFSQPVPRVEVLRATPPPSRLERVRGVRGWLARLAGR